MKGVAVCPFVECRPDTALPSDTEVHSRCSRESEKGAVAQCGPAVGSVKSIMAVARIRMY